MQHINHVTRMELYFEKDTYENTVHKALKCLRPKWINKDIVCEPLKTGSAVSVYCCHVKGDVNKTDAINFKIYDIKSSRCADHDQEGNSMILANRGRCAMPVYAFYPNAVAYKYAVGRELTWPDLWTPEIYSSVFKGLARFNYSTYEPSNTISNGSPTLFETMATYLENVPEEGKQLLSSGSVHQNIRNIEDLKKEISLAKEITEMLKPCTVYSHGDFHQSNMIYNDVADVVNFVDFEYSGPCYEYYDLVHIIYNYPLLRFFNYPPMDDKYKEPNDSLKKDWIRIYLQEREELGAGENPITEEYINAYLENCKKFTMVVFLVKFLRALPAVHRISSRFDCFGFASMLCAQYFKWKEYNGQISTISS